MKIYKICSAALWHEAERAGVKHFAGQADLLLVTVESDRLGDALKWEPSRGGALFPHLFGGLALSAVIHVEPLPLGPDCRHVFPHLGD